MINYPIHSATFPRGDFSSYDEFEDFIFDHYVLETNFNCQDLDIILEETEVILLGEVHREPQHAEWNGRVINAIWNDHSQLFVEHEPIGADGQLNSVDPQLAKNASQWDFTQSKTSALFDQLVELSALIKGDFKSLAINGPQPMKQLLKQGEKLIDKYLISPTSVEGAWEILDHSIARILDEAEFKKAPEERLALMYKQAYLRVWVHAALESMNRFLHLVEDELEERNGWMAKIIEKALHKKKRVILIAGSEHFSKTIKNAQKIQIENPVLAFLKEHKKKCLLLQPIAEQVEEQVDIANISHVDLEKEINHLTEELTPKLMKQSLQEIEGLKNYCVQLVEHSLIETHDQAIHAPYMVGAICLRLDRLTKTIQIWNVIVEIALVHDKWMTECKLILGR